VGQADSPPADWQSAAISAWASWPASDRPVGLLAAKTPPSGGPATLHSEAGKRPPQVKIESAMKFLVSVYQDEDGVYIAECPSIPGCVSQGQTESEAEVNIADAVRECLAARAELGIPLTVATREVEVTV